MTDLAWIGVTGMGRSGTTFLGSALALPEKVAYLHEPFNPSCGVRGVDWSDPALLDDDLVPNRVAAEAIERILRLKGGLVHYAPGSDPVWKRAAKRLVGGRGPVALRRAKLTAGKTHGVLKDPVGFYLFPHLQAAYGVQTLLVVKHPVASVAGHVRVNWLDGIEFIRDRPYLMSQLTPTELEGLQRDHQSPAELIAWQWRITYGFLLRKAKELGWRVALIEEVSQHPVEAIRELYEAYDLPWTPVCGQRVERLTGASNQARARGGRVQDLRRDSRQVFAAQIDRVSSEDRRLTFEITRDLALDLYDETSFGLN